MKKHYDFEEMLDILRKELYQAPELSPCKPNGNSFGMFDRETLDIARAINFMTFERMRRIAKAIGIISQGTK